MAFTDITFGYADAQTEGAEAPELLLDGFIDEIGMDEKVLSGPSFLFLGYKGSGKTALAERARLLARARSDGSLFVTKMTFGDFSHREFQALAGDDPDAETRLPVAWGWVLLLHLIESLETDAAGHQRAPKEYRRTLEGLRSLQVLPVRQLPDLVRTSKRGFKASIPKLFEYSQEQTSEPSELQLSRMVHVLREAALSFPTTSRHVVFVDGLDDVLTRTDLEYQTLAALVTQAARLNDELRDAGRPFKFVVLCRTDIFDRLPGANKNKIRRDRSETLDWFDDPRDPDRTRLVRLVTRRAQLALGEGVDLFGSFFPRTLNGRPIRRALLDYTRHLPRDVVQLMVSIQRFADPGEDGVLTHKQIMSGLRDYSNNYFVRELEDELQGYIEPSHVQAVMGLLSRLGAPRFTMETLERRADELGLRDIDLDVLVRTLFECSGIGMLDQAAAGRRPVVTFRFRNPNAMLDRNAELLIHRGALRGLNIPEL